MFWAWAETFRFDVLTACDVVSLGRRFPTFRRNVLPSSRIKRSQKTLFDRQGQDTMIVRNVGNHSPNYCKTRLLFALNALHFLTDCAAVNLLRSTVLQGVVMWLVGWLVVWLVGCLIRNDCYRRSFGSHVMWLSVSERLCYFMYCEQMM